MATLAKDWLLVRPSSQGYFPSFTYDPIRHAHHFRNRRGPGYLTPGKGAAPTISGPFSVPQETCGRGAWVPPGSPKASSDGMPLRNTLWVPSHLQLCRRSLRHWSYNCCFGHGSPGRVTEELIRAGDCHTIANISTPRRD
jgi:hypothetical protein